jgi:hypothetical protein
MAKTMEFVLTFNEPISAIERYEDPKQGPALLEPWKAYMAEMTAAGGVQAPACAAGAPAPACAAGAQAAVYVARAQASAYAAADAAAREACGRLLAWLAWQWRDIAAAEDALAQALATALEHWPREGVPLSPQGWLLTAAKCNLL